MKYILKYYTISSTLSVPHTSSVTHVAIHWHALADIYFPSLSLSLSASGIEAAAVHNGHTHTHTQSVRTLCYKSLRGKRNTERKLKIDKEIDIHAHVSYA